MSMPMTDLPILGQKTEDIGAQVELLTGAILGIDAKIKQMVQMLEALRTVVIGAEIEIHELKTGEKVTYPEWIKRKVGHLTAREKVDG